MSGMFLTHTARYAQARTQRVLAALDTALQFVSEEDAVKSVAKRHGISEKVAWKYLAHLKEHSNPYEWK